MARQEPEGCADCSFQTHTDLPRCAARSSPLGEESTKIVVTKIVATSTRPYHNQPPAATKGAAENSNASPGGEKPSRAATACHAAASLLAQRPRGAIGLINTPGLSAPAPRGWVHYKYPRHTPGSQHRAGHLPGLIREISVTRHFSAPRTPTAFWKQDAHCSGSASFY